MVTPLPSPDDGETRRVYLLVQHSSRTVFSRQFLTPAFVGDLNSKDFMVAHHLQWIEPPDLPTNYLIFYFKSDLPLHAVNRLIEANDRMLPQRDRR